MIFFDDTAPTEIYTPGIQDSEIKVASIDKVSGEGALTGIYKAYEENGNSLNKDDVQNANNEMNDLASISEQNKGQKGYSDEALNCLLYTSDAADD
ncbi:hypothetical protein JMUB7520_27470 [Staphylococcus aureus]